MNSRLEKFRNLKLDVPADPPVPSRRWLLWLVIAIVVASVAFLAFNNASLRTSIDQPATTPTAATPTARAAPGTPAPSGFTAAGYIEPIPPFPIHVSPLVLGRIDEFSIVEGQPVKTGDVIAKLNSQEFEKRLAELRAELAVNAERLALAESELTRSRKLTTTGVATAKEFEQASADAAIHRATGVRLQAEIATVEWQIQQTAVRAPVDGILFERLANVGDYIHSDSDRKIASIYDPAKLQVWVDVNQRDATRLREGQPVEAALDSEPGKVFSGKVSRVLPRASLSKNTIQAKILLDQTTPSLRPDMSVKVTFLAPDVARAEAEKTATSTP